MAVFCKGTFIFKKSVISNELFFLKKLLFEIIIGTFVDGLFVDKLQGKVGCY